MAALKKLYEQTGLEWPDIYVVVDSPTAAVKYMKDIHDVDVNADDFLLPAQDAWLAKFDFFFTHMGFDEGSGSNIKPYMELAEHCGPCLVMDEIVVLCQRPKWITPKGDGTFIITFRDGTGSA